MSIVSDPNNPSASQHLVAGHDPPPPSAQVALAIKEEVYSNAMMKKARKAAEVLASSFEQLSAIHQVLVLMSTVNFDSIFNRLCGMLHKLRSRRARWNYFYSRHLISKLRVLSLDAVRLVADAAINAMNDQNMLIQRMADQLQELEVSQPLSESM